jgi:hypothetical protein
MWTAALLMACSGRVPQSTDEDGSEGGSSTSVTQGSETGSSASSSSSSEEETGSVGCEDGLEECPDGSCVDPGGFIPDPYPCCDYDGECAGDGHCDPTAQDCPDGEKCTAYLMTPGYCCWDANKCVPVIGDKDVGEPCTRVGDNDDCARGMICVGAPIAEDGPGWCVAFCGDFDSPDPCVSEWANQPNADCFAYADGVFPHCIQKCDPLLQECPNGQGCYPGPWGFACTPEGGAAEGDPCTDINGCQAGLLCIPWQMQEGCAGDSCCTSICDCSNPNDPICTEPGEQCICYYEQGEAPNGYDDTGMCFVP